MARNDRPEAPVEPDRSLRKPKETSRKSLRLNDPPSPLRLGALPHGRPANPDVRRLLRGRGAYESSQQNTKSIFAHPNRSLPPLWFGWRARKKSGLFIGTQQSVTRNLQEGRGKEGKRREVRAQRPAVGASSDIDAGCSLERIRLLIFPIVSVCVCVCKGSIRRSVLTFRKSVSPVIFTFFHHVGI